MTLETLRSCLDVVEVRLDLRPSWRGPELNRLLDEDHAGLQAAWVQRMRQWDWDVRVEASFNHYGDRGRIDLLAFHPRTASLVVGEIKTELVDAQDLLGQLDVKVRVARQVAAQLGWPAPKRVYPLLIIRSSSTARDRLRRLAPLFAAFSVRGRAGVSCLRQPERLSTPLLVLSDLRSAGNSRVKQVATHRVRR